MNKEKAAKLAKLLEFERDYIANPVVKTLQEIERCDSAISEVKDEINTIKDDSQKIVEAINQIDQTLETRIDNKIASIPPIRGDRGFKGEKGDIGPVGPKGDTVIVDKIIERTEVIKEVPIVTENVVERTTEEISGEKIVDRINTLPLTDENRIEADHIKGLERFQKTINTAIQTIGSRVAQPGVSTYSALTDVNMAGLANGNVPIWDSVTSKWLPGVATSTDEKVKYSATTNAGYLGALTKGGTGITLAQGTGADIDKLIITNSGVITETDPIFTTWLGTNPLSSYTPTSRKLTINGTQYDLSSDCSWTISPIFDNTISGAGTVLSPYSVVEGLGLAKTISYNVDGTVNVITSANGTKTMAYNGDGTLASITGTGIYKNKTFTYSSGQLTAITT